MNFDNLAFTKWLKDFEAQLLICGMEEADVLRYRRERYKEAVAHFAVGNSPEDAAVIEVVG